MSTTRPLSGKTAVVTGASSGIGRAIALRFGLPPTAPAAVKTLVKRADRVSAWFEAVRLAGFSAAEADSFFGRPPEGLAPDVRPLPPAEAQARYLARFQVLSDALAGVGSDGAFDSE